MEGDGNELSDDRIAEACLREIMEEDLREGHQDNEAPALPLSPSEPSETERHLKDELGIRIRQQSLSLKGNRELQDLIDRIIESPGSMTTKFTQLACKVFEDGVITWEKTLFLFYVARKMAVKVMEAHYPHLVTEIFRLTMDYFRENLLDWVRRHGGWRNCLSELSGRMQGMPFTTKQTLIFITYLAFLSIITWKLTRRT